jgi:hypothetical protein
MERLNEWLGWTELAAGIASTFMVALEVRADDWKMGVLFGIMTILFLSNALGRFED